MPAAEPDPEPRSIVDVLPPARLSVPLRKHILHPLRPAALDFDEVFLSRRSARSLSRARLKDVLGWLAYATDATFETVWDGIPRSRRPALAAGALHGVQPVLISGIGRPRAWRLDIGGSVVEQILVAHEGAIRTLREKVGRLLLGCVGCDLVILVSDDALFAAAYSNWETLAWRDAGALLQTLALAATSLGLGFCPLGALGTDALIGLGASTRFRALGLGVIGV